MARKLFGRGVSDKESGGHGDRPWVYFMIDSFFLVTQFFVLTFTVRTQADLILPHRLPGSVGGSDVSGIAVGVSVNRSSETAPPTYAINGGEPLDLSTALTKLDEMTVGKDPLRFSVRIAYTGSAVFGDVMPVFNECTRLGIKHCGLQPSRDLTRRP